MRIKRRFLLPAYRSFVAESEKTFRAFSASGRVLFFLFAGLLALSTLGLVYTLNTQFLRAVPAHGGSIREGIIGSPRFINPVLALSDADHDLTNLVYSGLLRATPAGGYIPDLAKTYTISDDGRIYTVVLKDATFHDGTPVSAEDVAFTIARTQDPALKSPGRANWKGVAVTVVDAKTIQFTLKQAYAPFIENLTFGILPKHLWQGVSTDEMPFSELNSAPIGSGPFMMGQIRRTSSGIPSSYVLEAFSEYALGKPYLNSMTLYFYQNEDELLQALAAGDIEMVSGISANNIASLENTNIARSSLNRVFGVFFNQNQSEVLRDPAVRQALSHMVDRADLVEKVLGGYGTPLTGPVPPSLIKNPGAPIEKKDMGLASADTLQLLREHGWTPGPDGMLQKVTRIGNSEKATPLAFSLATSNVPELRTAAEYLRHAWGTIGIKVDVHVYDQGDLSQNVIRPRKYDALLFGEVVGRELDLFAFWGSTQRVDPGLNIALYASVAADKILEELRQSNTDSEREQLYHTFAAELAKDIPAIFLYAPDFMYIVPKDVQGLGLGFIETPSDRFLSAYQWHREVDYVWPFFARTQ